MNQLTCLSTHEDIIECVSHLTKWTQFISNRWKRSSHDSPVCVSSSMCLALDGRNLCMTGVNRSESTSFALLGFVRKLTTIPTVMAVVTPIRVYHMYDIRYMYNGSSLSLRSLQISDAAARHYVRLSFWKTHRKRMWKSWAGHISQ